jgi:hypothetical protein
MRFQRIGGLASIGMAILSVVMFINFYLFLPRIGIGLNDWNNPVKWIDAYTAFPGTALFGDIQGLLWGLFIVPYVLVLKNRLEDVAPNMMWIAFIGASVASALWIFVGTIGIVARPPIIIAKDISAYRVFLGTSFSLLRMGDFAMGWAFLMIGLAGLKTVKLSNLLSWLLVFEGILYIAEMAEANLYIIASILLIITSIWIGMVLLAEKPD